MSERIGTEIAGYRIESLIARGGMGEVYLAVQSFPERKVALKLLSPDLAADPAFRERFIRESNAAASTEHPNIVPIYGAGESDGELYLAMRYVEGTDLRTLLDGEGPLDPDRAARICAEIADALEAAHERGLVHRDVKPGNILLDARDRAYLMDFGLIRRTRIDTGLTKTGQFMGTVDYVAPEQIKGEAPDGRADVYSLGCVLYECLTGDPPFRSDSEVATLYAQLESTSPKPSDKRPEVPTALDAVVAKATAKRPEERFATAGEIAGDLRGTRARVEARPTKGGRTIAAAAAVIAALVAIVAFLALQDEGAPSTPPVGGPTTGSASIPLNSLVQIDAETGEILATVPGAATVGPVLPQVEVGEGGIWISSRETLTHVDPDEASLLDTIALGPHTLGASMAVGYRTIWVGAPPGIVRIDPIDGEELRPIRLYPPGVFSETLVTLGASSAWAVTGDGELTRIDPETAVQTGTIDVGQSASGIAVGLEGVWVIDKLQGTLVRVDPGPLEVDQPILIAGELDNIAVGASAVWLLDRGAGVVIPYDPASGSTGSSIRVGLEPTDIAVGLDAVWVANHGDGTISHIDPVTSAVETIPIGAPVASIAVDESTRSLWIVIAESRE